MSERSKQVFSSVLLFVTSLITLGFSTDQIFNNSDIVVDGNLATIFILWFFTYAVTAYITHGNLYIFSMAYVLPLIIFHFGLILQHALGIKHLQMLIGKSGYWYGLASWYVMLSLSAIGIGLSFHFKKPENIKSTKNNIHSEEIINNLLKLRSYGRGLLWASLVLLVIAIAQNGNIFAKSRFDLFYSGDTRAIGVFSMLCPTAALVIMSTAIKGKNLLRSVVITGLSFMLLILSGYRSVALFPLLIGAIIWRKNGRKIPLTIASFAVIAVLIIIPIIGHLRTMSYGKVDLEDINKASESSDISHSFEEMGRSIGVLAVTLENIPKNEDFRYGYTYLLYFPALVPNIGFGKTSNIGRAALYERMNKGEKVNDEMIPGDWATWKIIPAQFRAGGGTGFTGVGEPYMNFGYTGVLIFFILLGWMLGRMDSKDISSNFKWLCFSTLYYWNFLVTVRNDLSVFLKPVVFTFLTILIWKQIRKIVPFLDKI
jgi:oligosaccharide repeat unit polymerase